MLVIRSGNRVETLARDLGRHLALHPPRDPVDPLFVVVPTRGVERFLSDHLALESGISARVRFDFPARVVRSLLRCAVTGEEWSPEDPPSDPWDPDRLVWHVLEALPSLLDMPSFRPLREYLVQAEALPTGPVGREEYGLARMAADLLDEVAIYRPQWARAWSRNDPLVPRGASRPVDEAAIGAAWQRDLWRHLERRIGEHPFSRLEEAIARLEDPSFQPGLPDRICLFGIVTLPPSFLQVFLALGRRPDLEVRMDLLTCTRGYFGDTPRSRRLRRVRQGEIPLEPGEAHEDTPWSSAWETSWRISTRSWGTRRGTSPRTPARTPSRCPRRTSCGGSSTRSWNWTRPPLPRPRSRARTAASSSTGPTPWPARSRS